MAGTSNLSSYFGVRLLHADRSKLDRLAEQAGASRGEVVKRLLRAVTPEQVTESFGGGAVDSEAARTNPQLVQ